MRASSVTVVLLLLSCALSGCMGSSDKEERSYPSIWERSDVEWDTSGTFSRVLEAGPYHALEVKETMIEVDTSSVWETGPSTAEVHLSYWLPSNTLDGEQVPVIAVISPYFSNGSPGDESTPTNIVGGDEGSSSSRISSPMGMHSHRSQFSEQRRVAGVSITGVQERGSVFTPQ